MNSRFTIHDSPLGRWCWRGWRKLRWRWERRGEPRYFLEVIDGQAWIFPADDRNLLDGGRALNEWIRVANEGGVR